jgi:hypothetical protein
VTARTLFEPALALGVDEPPAVFDEFAPSVALGERDGELGFKLVVALRACGKAQLSQSETIAPRREYRKPLDSMTAPGPFSSDRPCAFRKSFPNVMVVQARQNWDSYNDPGPLHCPT